MKLKKMVLYAAPIALAGALYLGGASGIDEVLAKTIKTKVTGALLDDEIYISRDFVESVLELDWATFTEFEYGGGSVRCCIKRRSRFYI